MAVRVRNNPAGRLYDLIYAARQQPPSNTIRAVWAEVFGINPMDTILLLRSLADLIDLAAETKNALSRLPDVDVDLYLQPFASIEQLLSMMNIDRQWTEGINLIDKATLQGLQFGADKLSRVSGFTEIEQSDLDQLRESVEQLLNEILAAKLPEALTQLFVRNLETLRQALLGYRLRGVQGLEQEMERALGSMVMHYDQVKACKEGSAEQKTWKSYAELLTRFNALVTAAKNIKELGVPAITYLLEKLM